MLCSLHPSSAFSKLGSDSKLQVRDKEADPRAELKFHKYVSSSRKTTYNDTQINKLSKTHMGNEEKGLHVTEDFGKLRAQTSCSKSHYMSLNILCG